MSQTFPAEGSPNSLKWAAILAILVDVPFILVLLLSGGETKLELHPTMVLPLAISGLIIYASYSAGKMEYVLEEDALSVSFPLSTLRISYIRIRYAGKVETSLRFRVFGGSLPGARALPAFILQSSRPKLTKQGLNQLMTCPIRIHRQAIQIPASFNH
jgi:hypothetical protein